MKNIINFLSNTNNFFNEKRFVNRGIDTPNNREVHTDSGTDKLKKLQDKNVKRLRENFLNNPNTFKEYSRLSQQVTKNLANLGVPKPKLESSKDSSDGLGTTMVDQEKYATLRQNAMDNIAKAFNKNDSTRMFLFKALVDLHIYKKFVNNKAKRIQIYQTIAKKLKRISPRTYASLPGLKKTLLSVKTAVATRGRRKRSR